MKRNLILLTAVAATLAFASCSKSESTTPAGDNPDPSGRVAVQFTGATLDVEPAPAATRAESQWTQKGTIGIYALGEETTDIVDGYANVGYTFNGSQSAFFPDAETIYFPVDGSKRRFAAYFPYEELEGTTYEVDLSEQPTLNDQTAFELLWTVTGAYDKTQPNVALKFDHQYAKVSIKVQNGTGIEKDDLGQMTVAMTDMYLTGEFDVVTGTMTPTGDADALTFWRNGDGSGQYALVMPTQARDGRTVNFTLGSDTFRWAIGEKKFEAGKTYDYTVKVSRTPLGFTATVTDWEKGESGSGDAE